MTQPKDRVIVRLCDGHPAATRKEVAKFKNVSKREAIRLLAAAQITLWGTTSMWDCELWMPDAQAGGGWRPFGPRGKARVKAEVERLAALWHPMDELHRTAGE